jgi:hypothetical protein
MITAVTDGKGPSVSEHAILDALGKIRELSEAAYRRGIDAISGMGLRMEDVELDSFLAKITEQIEQIRLAEARPTSPTAHGLLPAKNLIPGGQS